MNSSAHSVREHTDAVPPATDAQWQAELRKLPSVDALLQLPATQLLIATYSQGSVTDTLREILADVRQAIRTGGYAPTADAIVQQSAAQLTALDQSTLRAVINATGVIIHTNLGRAPLAQAALDAMVQVAQGYSNLEYELAAGMRGSRHDHARALLADLTGAEDAIVVNNNAAAIYFILTALCQGMGKSQSTALSPANAHMSSIRNEPTHNEPTHNEVIVSRGQLVEIGGGFRIPDVLRQSGAALVEVGTTNRTHARDFATAVTPATAALMRIHTSNFKQIGFVTMPTLAEMAEIAHAHNVLLIDDLGSGTLLDAAAYGLAPEPLVQESIAAGADLVTFSGDKLLGGPQAGIIVGRQELIAQLRRHPMARALRVDKLTFAALDATLRIYQRGRATTELPVWQMISAPLAALQARAEQWQQQLATHGLTSEIVAGESAVGGGSLPGETLPTALMALSHAQPDAIAERLRQPLDSAKLSVVCRIQQGQLVFDPRTVAVAQEAALLQRLIEVLCE